MQLLKTFNSIVGCTLCVFRTLSARRCTRRRSDVTPWAWDWCLKLIYTPPSIPVTGSFSQSVSSSTQTKHTIIIVTEPVPSALAASVLTAVCNVELTSFDCAILPWTLWITYFDHSYVLPATWINLALASLTQTKCRKVASFVIKPNTMLFRYFIVISFIYTTPSVLGWIYSIYLYPYLRRLFRR